MVDVKLCEHMGGRGVPFICMAIMSIILFRRCMGMENLYTFFSCEGGKASLKEADYLAPFLFSGCIMGWDGLGRMGIGLSPTDI